MTSSPSEAQKRELALLLAAWPAAAALGGLAAAVTATDWPAAALPMAWLAVLFARLRRVSDASLT